MISEAVPSVDQALVVDLARGFCRIPSPRPQEQTIALYVAQQLARLGFEVELQDVVEGRPNVVARLRGDPEYQSFMFNGHIDALISPGEWSRDPYDPWIDNGVLYGGGLQDMKGGLASLIAGAAAVANADLTRRGDIIVTAVMDHDTIGLGTKYFLASNSWRIDAGVCGEPTNLKVQLFHGGAWVWEVTAYGIARHQSRLEEGINAVSGMIRILERFDTGALTYAPDPAYPHLPRMVVGVIQGGEAAALTAERCVARGDVRFLPTMTIDGMKDDLRRIVDAVCAQVPGLTGEVRTFAQQWPYQVAEDEPVVQSLSAAHTQVTGEPPEITSGLPSGAFITDAADMIRYGIPTVLYGPGDWSTAPDESIPIRDLVTAAEVYAVTCRDVITHPRR